MSASEQGGERGRRSRALGRARGQGAATDPRVGEDRPEGAVVDVFLSRGR